MVEIDSKGDVAFFRIAEQLAVPRLKYMQGHHLSRQGEDGQGKHRYPDYGLHILL